MVKQHFQNLLRQVKAGQVDFGLLTPLKKKDLWGGLMVYHTPNILLIQLLIHVCNLSFALMRCPCLIWCKGTKSK